MKTKLVGIALFALTVGAVAYYPQLNAKSVQIDQHVASQRPVVDVVFVLDTTGSMSGLIETAKEKIWSIASTMASAQPTPDIRIGLVGYRDKGDEYVTRVVNLSGDLDSVYASLMEFQAGGGGDTPESVNKALYDAVHSMTWSRADQAYQVIFLVGDAPPHMDYHEVQYPAIVAAANEKGIVINTIQSGNIPTTVVPWTTIASLGNGNFFQVDQAGGAVAYESPFDKEIADLSAKLDATRLSYGTDEERERTEAKFASSGQIASASSVGALARRGVFNSAAAGRENLLGEKELVDAVASGDVELEAIEKDDLPAALKPMAPEEQKAYIAQLAGERADIQRQIRSLADDRDEFLAKKVEEAGGMADSLDAKLYEAVKDQAGKVGLTYESGPSY
ncbi:MAG: VWA domain-containing protein [Proteobacteria bacterium]|nr:VWA domain-containing protein [Pseudomonadota bacterium]MDA0993089.1 VWA domain-containing protein [Pseudomonadota bacterium]